MVCREEVCGVWGGGVCGVLGGVWDVEKCVSESNGKE